MTPELTRLRDELADDYTAMILPPEDDSFRDTFKDGFDAGAKAALSLSEELVEALKYYAHPDHYTETMRMEGLRQPGVLIEGGDKARKALAKFKQYSAQESEANSKAARND